MADPKTETEEKHVYRERGSSGMGTILGGIALGAVALVAAAFALEIEVPLLVIAAVGGALGLAGSGLYLNQAHKEKLNDEHARRAYKTHKGYHHETERVLDQSLLHLMKGPSDLPERAEYIEEHYGIKPKTRDQFQGGGIGLGLAIGIAVGIPVAAAVTFLAAPFIPLAAGAFGALFGILSGATATMMKSANDTKRYERYLDQTAARGKWELEHKAPEKKPEYQNIRVKPGTFAGDIAATREIGPTTVQVTR